MLFLFFLFLRIQGFILFFLFFQFLDFKLSQFLRKYRIVIFGLKFIAIEIVNCFVDNILILFNFFLHLVYQIWVFFDFLLCKFDHQIPINAWFFIKHVDSMSCDRFIEYNVFYLSSCLTNVCTELINKEEIKLEFRLLIFYEFQII